MGIIKLREENAIIQIGRPPEFRDCVGGDDACRTDRLLATKFVVSDDLAIEAQDDTHVTVVNLASSKRLKLSRLLYQFLQSFEIPRTISRATESDIPDNLLKNLQMLVNVGILIDADAPPTAASLGQRRAVAYKFCNAPVWTGPMATAGFAILGIPYDLSGDADCRLSASKIRERSLSYAYRVPFGSGKPQGWFDANCGARILRGASMTDLGDVRIEFGENQHELFDRIDGVLQEVSATSAIPVVLGGDRSITYVVSEHMSKRNPITVVQFATVPATASVRSADVVGADEIGTRLVLNENVERFISLGATTAAPLRVSCVNKIIDQTADALRLLAPDKAIQQLGINSDIHLSIDLSVTAVVEGRGEDVQSGLTIHELKDLIRALGRAHRIGSIDLVGLDNRDAALAVSTVSACHLALTAMSAAYDRF